MTRNEVEGLKAYSDYLSDGEALVIGVQLDWSRGFIRWAPSLPETGNYRITNLDEILWETNIQFPCHSPPKAYKQEYGKRERELSEGAYYWPDTQGSTSHGYSYIGGNGEGYDYDGTSSWLLVLHICCPGKRCLLCSEQGKFWVSFSRHNWVPQTTSQGNAQGDRWTVTRLDGVLRQRDSKTQKSVIRWLAWKVDSERML
jgi:hypothetical protein